MEKGDAVTAAAAFDDLMKQFPDHDYGALAAMKLGDISSDAGRFDDAASYYGMVESRRKDEAVGCEASYKKGLSFLKAGKTDQAIGVFNELIARRPLDIMAQKARLELAEEAIRQGRGDDAVKLAEKVIESVVDENAARAQYIIGKRYYVEGNYQRAHDELMRVTIIYKTYEEWAARAKNMIAQSLAALGKKDDAQKVIDEVIESHPRDEIGVEAKKIRSEIE